MGSVLESLPPGARFAAIRLRSLGDCVLTTPALHLLKQHRPDLKIGVVVEDRFRAVFTGNPDLDELLPPTISAVRAWRPAAVLNLHGGTRSLWMTLFSGARVRAAFAHLPGSAVYNVHIPRAQQILGEERKVHTAEHIASAMFYLGVPKTEIPRARLFAAEPSPVPGCAVIHPVAAMPDKQWTASGFLQAAEYFKSIGTEPVFIGAATDDLSPFQAYRTIAGASLETVKGLLSQASIFLGNDSGPAHMAAAFGVPVVVLFGSSDSVIWAPWRTASGVLTHPEGIAAILPSRVIGALERVKVHA